MMKKSFKFAISFMLAFLLAFSPLLPVEQGTMSQQAPVWLAQNNSSAQENIVDAISTVLPIGKQAIRVIVKRILATVSLTLEDEIKIGDIVHQEIAREWGNKLDRNQRDVEYLTRIGRTLARNVKRDGMQYKFHVIEENVLNAFAIAGGHIYFYRGLLNFFQNEAQFASVVGHEIGHVDAGHTLEYYKVISAVSQFPIADSTQVVAKLSFQILNQTYSEVQESEADKLGTDLAFKGCYDTLEGATLQRRFAELQKSGSPNLVVGLIDAFFRTHPPSDKRAKAIETQAKQQRKNEPRKKLEVGVDNYKRRSPITSCI